ncbi:MAG: hypothetical protein ACI86M_002965 [Saprospiraceae bacterium]|jgi:hypothetical protein
MKNILTIILATTLFISCGSEEEYPITYTFDKANEISSVVLTADHEGTIIEIDKYQSIENLGVSPFEFFLGVDIQTSFKSITIDSETDLTIDFGMDTPLGQTVSLPYTNNELNELGELSELGLIIEDDKIKQRTCFDMSISNVSLNANICDKEDAGIAGRDAFTTYGFSTNDTLAYSIIEFVYIRS